MISEARNPLKMPTCGVAVVVGGSVVGVTVNTVVSVKGDTSVSVGKTGAAVAVITKGAGVDGSESDLPNAQGMIVATMVVTAPIIAINIF